MTSSVDQVPDRSDVQALVRHGFSKLKAAVYLLLRVRDAAPARQWLRSLPLTNAADLVSPRARQMAFTAAGLRALGIEGRVLDGFAAEFLTGMAEPSRARRLGDVEANAPEHWSWGGRADQEPHVLLLLFATPDDLAAFQREETAAAARHGLDLLAALATAEQDGHEPFGFRDGINQPEVDWDGRVQRDAGLFPRYAKRIALGEFLLGYRNEYGQLTDRPLVDDARAELPDARDHGGKKDLGANGTYLVVRQLAQDVRGFWSWLDRAAGGDPAGRQRLAELMVGRCMDGKPLPGFTEDFTYDHDPAGRLAPLGAHIRRANPRNGDLPAGAHGWLTRALAALGFGGRGVRGDLVASSRFHRILRRGRDYGPPLSVADALRPAAGGEAERGLCFVGINASLSRQFEFIQGAWLASARFDGLDAESDPLQGTRDRGAATTAGSDFRYFDGGSVRRRLRGLPQFVRVRGGAYFFLPGLRAVRWLLRDREAP